MSGHVFVAICPARLLASLCLMCSAVPSSSEVPPTLPARDALSYYEGTWTLVNNPDGNRNWRETCSWLQGRKNHIACRALENIEGITVETLSIYTYDEASGDYLYYGFRRRGNISVERGKRIPNGFQFMPAASPGKPRTRTTLVEGDDGHAHTTDETLQADGTWLVTKTVEYLHRRP